MRFHSRGTWWLIVILMISAGTAFADNRARTGARGQKSVAVPTDSARMEKRWQEIQTILRPDRLMVACEEFLRDFPVSPYRSQVSVIQAGALQAIEAQRAAELSGDLFEDAVGDSAYQDNLVEAVRGDKDAAYRIALGYKTGSLGVGVSLRRMEQWLRFSAELGSGAASWDLAEFYNRTGLVADAARFEKKALDLGYQPAIRLPTRGY